MFFWFENLLFVILLRKNFLGSDYFDLWVYTYNSLNFHIWLVETPYIMLFDILIGSQSLMIKLVFNMFSLNLQFFLKRIIVDIFFKTSLHQSCMLINHIPLIMNIFYILDPCKGMFFIKFKCIIICMNSNDIDLPFDQIF